jgi:HEAT repeat protein
MAEFSSIPEVNECLNRLYKAKSGRNSQAIADTEFLQNKLYELAKNHWKELHRIIKEGNFYRPDFMSDILWALRGIPEKEVITLFKYVLSNHKDWEMRYSAIGALSRLNDIDLIDTFILALKDTDSSVQFRAVNYLEKFGDTRALISLKKIKMDENLQKTCPGLIDSANRAIERIESVSFSDN